MEKVLFYQHKARSFTSLTQCKNNTFPPESAGKTENISYPPSPLLSLYSSQSRYVCVWLQCFFTHLHVSEEDSCSLRPPSLLLRSCFDCHLPVFCFFFFTFFLNTHIQQNTHSHSQEEATASVLTETRGLAADAPGGLYGDGQMLITLISELWSILINLGFNLDVI